jgi:hypothetical protein
VPPAFDRPILVVVVALLEMALSVAVAAGHRANREHKPDATAVRNARSTIKGYRT